MNDFIQFDTVEDMFKFLEDQAETERSEALRLKDWVASFKIGHYYLLQSSGLVIYGQILPWTDKEDEENFSNSALRLVMAHSKGCPEGEMGTQSIIRMVMRIDDWFFAIAKEAGWPLGDELVDLFRRYPGGILSIHPGLKLLQAIGAI